MYKKHLISNSNNQSNGLLWHNIENEYFKSLKYYSNKAKPVDKDLKIIRIFISSTFKDFYDEREVLVRNVFPKLRRWCEEQGLFLVECDLRWGVPADATNFEAVSYCLDEIDKSRIETNNHNFFLCLIGDRYGWVPSEDNLVTKLKSKYGFIENSSVTLMEIVHGVLRSGTENCLFMIRSSNILNDIPEDHLKFYKETDSDLIYNVEEQKKFIVTQFSKIGYVKEYKITYNSKVIDSLSGKERLTFTDFDDFSNIIEEHFKKLISNFKTNCNLLSVVDENEDMIHTSFLSALIHGSLKRDLYINNLGQRISETERCDELKNSIILLTGDAGCGKSTTVGHLIEYFRNKDECNVFYHFCGASNTSHTESNVVKRFQNYLQCSFNVSLDNKEAENQEIVLKDLLINPKLPRTVVFIDAVDEMWNLDIKKTFNSSTSKNILLIISCLSDMNPDSNYSQLTNKEYDMEIIPIEKMGREQLSSITSIYLDNFGKKLDSFQMDTLMSFENAENPLWLLSACEELRIHGDYSSLTNLITSLPSTIADLNRMVIKRITEQDKSNIIKTLLQLLLICRAGLWESIVRDILAAILNYPDPISHSLWSDVSRQLKGFLQVQSIPLPLIKLRHRVMKESIKVELAMEEEYTTTLHLKMAQFLEKNLDSANDMFLSDYLFHLVKSDARDNLIKFMRNRKSWSIVRQYFTRSKIMMSMKCTNPAQKTHCLMMCNICANKSGDLSLFGINKNCCFYCGMMVMNSDNETRVFLCTFHQHLKVCCICSNFMSGGEHIRICRTCKTQNSFNNCGVIVKENDVLFRQQLAFSKAVYKIETLI